MVQWSGLRTSTEGELRSHELAARLSRVPMQVAGWTPCTAGELGNLYRVWLLSWSLARAGRQSTAAGMQGLCATQNPASVGDLVTCMGGGGRVTPSSVLQQPAALSLKYTLECSQ